MKIFTFIGLIAVTLLPLQSLASIDDLGVKNAKGEIVFRVVDENHVKVLNRHRKQQPSLKLSLHGVKVNKVSSISASAWMFELSDKSSAGLSIVEKANVTEYSFLWSGAAHQSEKRELCFHYGYNEASW